MSCVTNEQLAALALGEADGREHVSGCPACIARLAELEAGLARLSEHAVGRERLLAAIAAEGAVPQSLWRRRWGMTRRYGAIAAVVAIGLAAVWYLATPASALAQAGKAMRASKGFTCEMALIPGPDGKVRNEVSRMVWSPDGMRLEDYTGGQLRNMEVNLVGRPGLSVAHTDRSYRRTLPDTRPAPFLAAVNGLAKYTGGADTDLEPKLIGGVKANGYVVKLSRIDPDVGGQASMEVWLDPATSRPVRIELVDLGPNGERVRIDRFVWDDLPPGAFDTTPPAGYTDKTPQPPSDEEIADKIVFALRTFAKYSDGLYPQVATVYGDVTRDALFQNAGFLHSPGSRADTDAKRAEIATDKWAECVNACSGFSWMNHLQRKNPDAAYFGKTVGPADADKVLFRWKRTDGRYQQIFGDLRTATTDNK